MARSENVILALAIVAAIVAAGIVEQATGDNRLAFGALVLIGVIVPTFLSETRSFQLS